MYWGFNMLDDTIGGYSEQNRKLRKAISIAFDVEEFISIFANGRGIVAQTPIPPGIFGYDLIYNDIVYDKKALEVTNQIQEIIQTSDKTNRSNNLSKNITISTELTRKPLLVAKKLLSEAGYPDGRNKLTGEPLVINFEAISSGDPNEKAVFSWLDKQFVKLGIQLNIRVTDYNRFQDKMKNGTAQMYFWGWNADYPDPENFLFMFYSPNAKVKYGGENSSNYSNPEFDKLFAKFNDSILCISYRIDGIPSINELIELCKKYKSNITVTNKEYKYVLSNNHSEEVLIIAR